MQDRFVGDVKDFGKYGLLRFLCGITGPPMNSRPNLGVIWLFNDDGESGGDSLGYLFRRFPAAQCDRILYHELRRLLRQDKRRVAEIQKAGFLPLNAEDSFIEAVPHDETPGWEWIEHACEGMADDVNLVFLDPDTGILPNYPANGLHEYVHFNGLMCCLENNRSVVAYQNASRNPNYDLSRFQDHRDQLEQAGRAIRVLRWAHQYSFLIIPYDGQHQAILWARLDEFLDSAWHAQDRFTEVLLQ